MSIIEDKRIVLLRNAGYSQKAIDFILNRVNIGEIEAPTVYVKQKGTCADILFLYLNIHNGIIVKASYKYIGCLGLLVCSSALTKMIKGMKVTDAKKITVQNILRFIGRIPKDKYDCAQIACEALQSALKKYMAKTILN